MPLRSATADTVAPGSSASVRTLTFCSAVQRLRRSTREMISPTLSIGVLTHVFKDANAHDLRQHNKGSSGLTLFEKVHASGAFANEHPADLAKAYKMLREFAAMEGRS